MSIVPVEQDLAHYEGIIERGRQTFIEVGTALMAIREDRLYREQGFDTFEEYCRERWGWTARRARQLTDAAEVVLTLKSGTAVPIPATDKEQPVNATRGTDWPLPSTERQVRELARAPDPEVQRAAWQFAVAENGPNASSDQVREAVEAVVEAVKEQPTILAPKTAGEQDLMESLGRMKRQQELRDEAASKRPAEPIVFTPKQPEEEPSEEAKKLAAHWKQSDVVHKAIEYLNRATMIGPTTYVRGLGGLEAIEVFLENDLAIAEAAQTWLRDYAIALRERLGMEDQRIRRVQ